MQQNKKHGVGAVLNSDFKLIRHWFADGIIVYPIADVHYGAIEHNETGWNQLIKEIQNQPNAFIVLNGDLINNSTRNSKVGTGVYDDLCSPRKQKQYMTEALAPIASKVLCILEGNHERRSREVDDSPTRDIACKLGIEHLFRESVAFMAIGIGDRKKGNTPNDVFRFAVTHGSGMGSKNEPFSRIIEGLDCLIVGHTHKGSVTRPSKLVIDCRNDVVVQRDFVICSCVSWMEYGGYAVEKMLLPHAHSQPQKLLLKGTKSRHTPKRIEVVW